MVRIRIWDLPLRLFHWALVSLVVFSAVTGQFGAGLGLWAARWHQLSGYAVLSLLGFRLAWGFVGSSHARFASFVRGPRAVLDYLAELTGRRPAGVHLGHNPLGGWSVAALLACLAVQAGTGLFIADEDLGVEGPLARFVGSATGDSLRGLHALNFFVLLALIATHLAAIAYYLFARGENLVRPMLTGVKQVPSALKDAAARGGHPLLGLTVLAASVGAMWYLANRI